MVDLKGKKGSEPELIIGICMVVFGCLYLVSRTLPALFPSVTRMFRIVMNFAWPICIIIAAAIVIVAVRKGVFTARAGKRFTRSRDNRKIAGICGGLAEYAGADALSIRAIAIILLIVSGLLLGVVYLILWAVIPET